MNKRSDVLFYVALVLLMVAVVGAALMLVGEVQDGTLTQAVDGLATQIGAWMSTPNIPGVKAK